MFMFNKVFSFFNQSLKISERKSNRANQSKNSKNIEQIKQFEQAERFETDFKNMNKDRKIRKIKEVFANIPRFETRRLILRRIKESDYIDIYEYSSDIEVTKYLTWYPHMSLKESKDYTSYLQKRYDSGKFFDWGLVCKQDG